jgi:hypothetical protein
VVARVAQARGLSAVPCSRRVRGLAETPPPWPLRGRAIDMRMQLKRRSMGDGFRAVKLAATSVSKQLDGETAMKRTFILATAIASIVCAGAGCSSSGPSAADTSVDGALPDTTGPDVMPDAGPPDALQSSWSTTGSLAVPRGFHFTTTVLASGKVLVAGGHTSGALAPIVDTAELYDPAKGTWTSAGSMTTPRASACAALLPSGQVLVAGGSVGGSAGGISTAEVYDPASNTWSATAQPMASAHDLPACAVLTSGKVLVAGGLDKLNASSNAVAEVYDPGTGTFTSSGSMVTARYWATATVLASGKVLVAGGCVNGYPCNTTTASSELYDPATGVWSATGDLPAGVFGHTATLLPSGKVLVVGGCHGDSLCGPESTAGDASREASLFDATSGKWTATGKTLDKHVGHVALLLAGGDVLLVGGGFVTGAGKVTERYNTTTGVWAHGPPPLADHGSYFGAARLQTGQWLVVGGFLPPTTSYISTDAAEIFTE